MDDSANISADSSLGPIDYETIQCPLCDSSEYFQVAQYVDWTYGVPGVFHSVRCRRCGHVFLNPRPTTTTMLAAYPVEYAPHQNSVDNPNSATNSPDHIGHNRGAVSLEAAPSGWRQFPPIVWLRRCWHWCLDDQSTWVPRLTELPNLHHELHNELHNEALTSPPRGLEVGCGSGWFSQRLNTQGWKMKAVEASPEAAGRAYRRGVEVWCGSLQDYHSDPEQFHAIFSWMVLEHLPFPQDALKNFHRWLMPKGTLVFSVPNHASLDRHLFGRFWVGYDGPRHFQHFEPKRLKELLAETGFDDIRIIHQPNMQYWFGSLKAMLTSAFSKASPTGPSKLQNNLQNIRSSWLMRQYHDGLSFPIQVILSPLAQLLRCLKMSGRLTVIARKR